MWIAVTVMSKTRREGTRQKIVCRAIKKSKLTVFTESAPCSVIKDLPCALNSLLLTFELQKNLHNQPIFIKPVANTVGQDACSEWPFLPCGLRVLLVPIPRAASISSLQGEVPGCQRCPQEQPGARQAACSCMALPAIPAGSSQANHRAAWHWRRSVPVLRTVEVTGSGCAWPEWPPKPTVARKLKGLGLLQCYVSSIMVSYPRLSHSGSNCGRNIQERSLHL